MTSSTMFDVREIPFSYRGAWLNLSPVTGLHTTTDTIHLVSHKNGMHAVLALTPEHRGEHVATDWQAEATRFAWHAPERGRVEAVFDGSSTLRLRGDGLGLRIEDAAAALTPFTGLYLFTDPVDDAVVFASYETGRRYRITLLSGRRDVFGDGALGSAYRALVLGGDGEPWEVALQETTTAADPFRPARTFGETVNVAAVEFEQYLDAVAPWRDHTTPAAARAAYVLWSATVAPEALVTRESVLMSKHWMDKLWSWDHCFNALALATGLTDHAIDQFLAPFDHQDDTGALPDSITHSEVLYNYVKPPIHGWTLTRLRERAGRSLTTGELEQLHDHLARWTHFWLDRRRRPGHELPYYQHGNDSGWDNSTTFDRTRVVESPDLAAFLVLQLEALTDLSEETGRPVEVWKSARDRLLDALLRELWTGDELIAKGALDGEPNSATSLLNLLPLVLGDRLPEDVRSALADRVQTHLTEFGLATEPITSVLYEDDGYWRGPIWAPSTALIESGLRVSGFVELADNINERFRKLCELSGFAENFDAKTGAGLRDRAYTWTAAVYLLFAADSKGRN